MIRRGNFACRLSQSRPILARDLVRVLVMKTSASSSSFIMTSLPFSDLRFSATKRLWKLATSNARFSSSLEGMPKTTAWFVRHGSPLNASTLMTSAPHSPRIRPVVGVAKNVVRSTTFRPFKGCILKSSLLRCVPGCPGFERFSVLARLQLDSVSLVRKRGPSTHGRRPSSRSEFVPAIDADQRVITAGTRPCRRTSGSCGQW